MFSPLNWLLGLFSLDIGIDLGTANTLVYVRHRGIMINEPSVVAIDKKSKKVLAIGTEAKEMVGRTPGNIVAIRPLRDGVISDFDVTEKMLDYFIRKVHERMILRVPRPRVVVGIPSGVTEVEKRAVYDATISAGAREAFLIEEPMAAAIGASLPVAEARGSMIIDIGGGTTEVAVTSLGGIVVAGSIRVAGDEMNEDIIAYARQKYNLLIGEQMAERVKIEAGSAYPLDPELTVELRGRNLITGLPEAVEISSVELREALRNSVSIIVDYDPAGHRRDAARTDRRPDGARDCPGGRRRTPEGTRAAADRRNAHEGLCRRRSAELRRTRIGHGARGLPAAAEDAGQHAAWEHPALSKTMRPGFGPTCGLTKPGHVNELS